MNWFKKISKKSDLKNIVKDRSFYDYNQKNRELGEKIELEHTNSKNTAKEIAMDHLDEFSNYYVELEKMEEKMKD